MDYRKAFETIVEQQLARLERLKNDTAAIDYKALDTIVIGIIGMIPVGFAYPTYQRVLKKERQRIAPEILRLSDELMK